MHQGGHETQHTESYCWVSIWCESGGARQVHNNRAGLHLFQRKKELHVHFACVYGHAIVMYKVVMHAQQCI